MKKLAFALSALAISAVTASAADMAPRYTKAPPPVAVYSWTGCYIGVNGGGGQARKDNTDSFANPAVAIGAHDATGGAAGGQIGCDYQSGQFVVGVRGLGDWANLNGRNTLPNTPAVGLNTRINSFEMLTARVAYVAAPNMLLYVQGGGAWVQERHQFLNPQPVVAFSESQTWNGWTAGGGIEFMFAPNWTVFGEYNHIWFDDRRTCFVTGSCPGLGANNPGGIIQRLSADLVMFGVNYRFNWATPVVAKY